MWTRLQHAQCVAQLQRATAQRLQRQMASHGVLVERFALALRAENQELRAKSSSDRSIENRPAIVLAM